MDQSEMMYDEFGNYIGPELESDDDDSDDDSGRDEADGAPDDGDPDDGDPDDDDDERALMDAGMVTIKF